ncbi:GMC oxidoreductase [Micromonospora sagamiensis]|uniref:Choline dehydrogenase-like flavoprotein n=1 Tax=Micromonospora sagamiensis TaxID=47875 RepID=A0A562WJ60_9ACTN|nr:GMC oxidoreductase [Micromonospora sagamiensis]TWJ30296.1 choline dehydrogenase-like flavoprotein [Micromonospora sagamiensis]BCL16674.1 hypothetical protein GCM10017556_44130 [Micromonospora sagamiensis]
MTTDIDTGVLVVGAGPVGVSLACRLARRGVATMLVEAAAPAAPTRNVGLANWPTNLARSSGFGGSLRHWRGLCRPFAEEDLRERSWVSGSGWPVASADLAGFHRDAARHLGVAAEYTIAAWQGAWQNDLPDMAALGLVPRVYALSPDGLALDNLRQLAVREECLSYLDGGRLVELYGDNASRSIHSALVRRSDGTRVRVRSRATVLAMGAIETARHLMHFGLGNAWVGRSFLDHPHTLLGVLREADTARLEPLLETGFSAHGPARMLLHLTPEAQDRHAVPAASLTAHTLTGTNALALLARTEQLPNPDSRLHLREAVDSDGVRLVDIAWNLHAADLRALRVLEESTAAAFRAHGLGRVVTGSCSSTSWPAGTVGACHHLGTTRMATSPDHGATDEFGRLHGLDNLWIAGGAVFPTGTVVNPTLTAVALGLRTADRIAELVPVTGVSAQGVDLCEPGSGRPDGAVERFIGLLGDRLASQARRLVVEDGLADAELLVLDLDGTLLRAHTEQLIAQVSRFVARFGYDVDAPTLHALARNENMFGFLRPDDVGVLDLLFWDQFDESSMPPALHDGALALLQFARACGLTIAVCTARRAEAPVVEQLLRMLGCPPPSLVVSAGPAGAAKSEMLVALCERAGVSTRRTVTVGDTVTDIVASRAAGIGLHISVGCGVASAAALAKAQPDVLVEDLGELLDLWLNQQSGMSRA